MYNVFLVADMETASLLLLLVPRVAEARTPANLLVMVKRYMQLLDTSTPSDRFVAEVCESALQMDVQELTTLFRHVNHLK